MLVDIRYIESQRSNLSSKGRFAEIKNRIKKDMVNGKWVLLGLVVYWLTTQLLFHEFCVTRILTGFPCPGCGMTRATLLMLTGHFVESFQMHPMVLPWVILGTYFCICRYVFGKRAKGSIVAAIVLCLIMMVLYIYRMATLFPYQEPMTYTPTGLKLFELDKIFGFLTQMW